MIILLATFLFCKCDPSSNSIDSNKDIPVKEAQSSTAKSETCIITCPHCGHKKTEILPTDVCQIKYNCEKCKATLTPKGDDCCVFCTFSTHKCPSKQQE